jgi:hypothetical protein
MKRLAGDGIESAVVDGADCPARQERATKARN